ANMPTLTAAVSISSLTINSGAANLTLAGFNLTLSSFTNAGTLVLVGTETVTTAPNNLAGSTVTFNSAGISIVLSTWTYRNLRINGTGGTFNATGAIDVDENLTLSAGTLDMTAGNYSLTISSNWLNTAGAFTTRASSITFAGASQGLKITSRAFPFNQAVFNGSGGYYTLTDSMTVSTITINSASTLDIGGLNFS